MEITDFPNYLIHRDGRVYSKKRTKFMRPYLNNQGYLHLSLHNKGKEKKFLIHRLIGIAYIPNPENKPCIDHINRITTDNRIENLRWATYSENSQNTGIPKNNKSGVKNIIYRNEHKRWCYQKMIDGKIIQEYFKTFEEALEFKNWME